MEYKILFGLFWITWVLILNLIDKIAITEIPTKDNGELYYKTGCGL